MIQAKKPGANDTRTVNLSLVFAEELGEAPEPYTSGYCPTHCGAIPATSRGRTVSRKPGASCSHSWMRRPGGEVRTRFVGPAGAVKLLAGHPAWREPWLSSKGDPMRRTAVVAYSLEDVRRSRKAD